MLKRRHKTYSNLILTMLSNKINFEDIKETLELPYDSLEDYLLANYKYYSDILNPYQELKLWFNYENLFDSLEKHFKKEFMYPFILFIMSFVLTLFFNFKFSKSILSLLDGFGVNKPGLYLIVFVMRLIMLIWFLFVLIILIVVYLLKVKDLGIYLFMKFNHFSIFKIIKTCLSLKFIFFYQHLYNLNLKTKDVLIKMTQINKMKDMEFIASKISSNLNKGNDTLTAFNLSYFDPVFLLQFKSIYYTNDINTEFISIIDTLREKLLSELKIYLNLFKTFVYSYLTFIIGIYYLFLFQPLSILEVF